MKFINESLTDVVYHFCSFDNTYNIIMSNRFYLTSGYNTKSDLKFQRGRMFYASFTRQFSGNIGYAKAINDMYSKYINKKTGKPINYDSRKLWTRITFDGRLLNNNYKGIQANNISSKKDLVTNRQSEDRLITNVPYIENITNYIVKVDILLTPKMLKAREKKIRTMVVSSGLGNRIRVFDNEVEFNNPKSVNFKPGESFLRLNGKDVSKDILKYGKNGTKNLVDVANAMAFVGYGEPVSARELIFKYNLVPAGNRNELVGYYKAKINSIRSTEDIDGFRQRFANLRHNIQGENKYLYANCINMIASYMREKGFRDFTDLIEYKKRIFANKHIRKRRLANENILNSIILESINSIINNKIRLVIFDFDGTLVDTTAIDDYRENAKIIKDKNIRLEYYRKFFSQTRVYPGIMEVLKQLNSMGVFIAVVSLSPMNMVKELCKYHNLPIQMAVSVPGRKSPLNVVKGNQTGYHKSSIYRILMRELGVKPNSTLAIGDEIGDSVQAGEAGIYFLGCNWGGKNEVNDITNPSEIIKYVNQ